MSRIIIRVNKIIMTILTLILPLIFGAPIRSSNSYWVFWYYSGDGNRSCGNYCYIVFSLVGAILLCICGCGCLRCYFIRRQFKSERLESNMNTQQILDNWNQELQMAEQNHQNQIIAQQQLQYPPLVHTHNSQYNHDSQYPNIVRDITPPPYDNNAYNAEIQKHALRQVESNWTAYKAGKDFTRNNPPNEILPPQDHSNYIKGLGGVEAWKFMPESSILQLNIASVTDDHILSFHARLDAMMQTNYPLIDMKYSTNNEDTNNHSSSSNSLPSTSSIITFPSNGNHRKDNKSSNTLTVNTASMNSMNLNDSSNNTSPMTVHSKSNLLSAPNSPLFPSPTNNINTNMIIDHSTTSTSSTSPPPPPPPYILQPFALQPPTDSWFFYYEITILSNPNKETTIAIGLATKPYPTFRLPGWNNHSVGYNSNDGKRFHNDGLTGRKYAEKWGEENDVVGCGYYPDTGQVFFTKNSINMGIAYTGLFHIWFPTIGSDGVCSLKVNFGQEEFAYKPANGMSVAGIIPKNITDQSIEEELNEKNMNESVT